MDVAPPTCQVIRGLIHAGTGTFDDKCAIPAEYVVQLQMGTCVRIQKTSKLEDTHVLDCPDARFGHSSYQVRPRKEHDPDIPMLPVLRVHPAQDSVYFIIKMVEHHSRALIVLESLP